MTPTRTRLDTLCVYCASSNSLAPEYFAAAEEVGRLMAERGLTLVYGGGKVGLMGALARALHRHGGKVVGVIPGFLKREELLYAEADEVVVTRDLRERKAIMESRAQAFLALPGGLGTIEELLEVLTLKQLRQHPKAIVLLNTRAFFTPLVEFLDRLHRERFLRQDPRDLYQLAATPAEVFAHLEQII